MIETERALPVCCVWMIHGAWMINCLSLNFLIRTLNFQSWNFNQDYGLRTLIFQNSSHFDWQEFKELLKAQISKSSSQFVNSVTSSYTNKRKLLTMKSPGNGVSFLFPFPGAWHMHICRIFASCIMWEVKGFSNLVS